MRLPAEVNFERLHFFYRAKGKELRRNLTPDPIWRSHLAQRTQFHGAFVGMACQDMTGTGCTAHFGHFEYRERNTTPHSERSTYLLAMWTL